MTEENNKDSKIKYCVHCGAEVGENKTYCPKCGKLVVKLTDSKLEMPQSKTKKSEISRTCPGCGSVITSSVLEQCPICNTILEKVPKELRSDTSEATQKTAGVIFTNKKFIPEKSLILKKDSWNLKEGISIFGNALVWYVTIRFLIIILLSLQTPTESLDVNITTILLSQIPDLIFSIYPLWYIYAKKHDLSKLGFNFNKKKVIIAIFIAILGTIILIFTEFISSFIIDYMYSVGINIVDIYAYLAEEHLVIQNSNPIWIIILIVLLSLGSISTEIIYRGVLHNTFKQYFQKNLINRIYVILLVALIYTGIYLLFSLPVGLYFFLINFIVFIILGIIYEINGNILNTIILSIIYNTTLILLIYYNVSLF